MGVQSSRERLLKVLEELNRRVVGHEEIHNLLMLALIAREHAVMISPPGTAKTYTIKLLAKMLGASFYSYLLTRFTTDIEILGPFDIPTLRDKGELVRKWSKIKDAEIVFLDEIFKANSAILNALLALMQERILYDPMTGSEIPTKLWSLFGASNEVPQDEELQALYDRFALRIFFDYLRDDASILQALHAKWLNANGVQQIASMDDVRALHDYAMKMIGSSIKGLGKFVDVYHVNVVNFVKELRSKGIVVSDRTIIEKLPKLVAAYCALHGLTVDNLLNAGINLLPYLARDRSEHEQIKKIINEGLGEVGELARKLEEAKAKMAGGDLQSAMKILEEIMNFDLSKIASRPWLKPRAEAIISTARKYYSFVQQQLETLKKMAETAINS